MKIKILNNVERMLDLARKDNKIRYHQYEYLLEKLNILDQKEWEKITESAKK